MRAQATAQDIAGVCEKIQALGFRPHVMPGAERTAIGITGNHGPVPSAEFEDLPGVAEAIPVSKPYKLVSREVKPDNTVVYVARRAGAAATNRRYAPARARWKAASRSCESARARESRRSPAAARRRLQAAHLALRVSRPGRRRPAAVWPKRARRPAWASSPKPSTSRPSTWWKNTPTASRSARATCRISRCCAAPDVRASRCC